MTDHMVVAEFDPETGWSDPEIKPRAPLSIDPASSCVQYGTTVFEGMKVRLSFSCRQFNFNNRLQGLRRTRW